MTVPTRLTLAWLLEAAGRTVDDRPEWTWSKIIQRPQPSAIWSCTT